MNGESESARSADLDVRSLRYLLVLAEHRSFTAASAALGISQPALSQAVARLERQVGGRLVVRDARGVPRQGPVLTPAGRALTADTGHVAQTLERALDRARQLAQQHDRRELVIGLGPGTPRQACTDLLRAISKGPGASDRKPALDVGLDVGSDVELDVAVRSLSWGQELSAVVRGGVDLVLMHLSCQERQDVARVGGWARGLRVVELGEVGRVVVVRAGHRLATQAEPNQLFGPDYLSRPCAVRHL